MGDEMKWEMKKKDTTTTKDCSSTINFSERLRAGLQWQRDTVKITNKNRAGRRERVFGNSPFFELGYGQFDELGVFFFARDTPPVKAFKQALRVDRACLRGGPEGPIARDAGRVKLDLPE